MNDSINSPEETQLNTVNSTPLLQDMTDRELLAVIVCQLVNIDFKGDIQDALSSLSGPDRLEIAPEYYALEAAIDEAQQRLDAGEGA